MIDAQLARMSAARHVHWTQQAIDTLPRSKASVWEMAKFRAERHPDNTLYEWEVWNWCVICNMIVPCYRHEKGHCHGNCIFCNGPTPHWVCPADQVRITQSRKSVRDTTTVPIQTESEAQTVTEQASGINTYLSDNDQGMEITAVTTVTDISQVTERRRSPRLTEQDSEVEVVEPPQKRVNVIDLTVKESDT